MYVLDIFDRSYFRVILLLLFLQFFEDNSDVCWWKDKCECLKVMNRQEVGGRATMEEELQILAGVRVHVWENESEQELGRGWGIFSLPFVFSEFSTAPRLCMFKKCMLNE